MATNYAPGAENVRRTHMNAIERVERFTLSDRFKTLDAIDLDARMELFKESFANFTEAHQKLVANVNDASKFGAEDALFGQIESKYQATIIRFRNQMDKVERDKLLESMARSTREKFKGLKLNERNEQSETRQQQQQRINYESELRHQRIVHQNDMVMQQQRTRTWVNDTEQSQLSKKDDMEWTKRQLEQRYNDLEHRHRALSEQLKNLTRRQQENEQHRVNQRERSRSPQRRSDPWAIVRNERQPQVVQINSTIHRTPDYDLRNVLGRIKNRECHFCRGNHLMPKCPRFLELNVAEREQHVHVLSLCGNCFMPTEGGRHRCQFGNCWNCGPDYYHNSLLCPNAKK